MFSSHWLVGDILFICNCVIKHKNFYSKIHCIFIAAKRSVQVNLGEPFGSYTIERGMLPLKFYHDFNCEIELFSYAFGPCWEPVIAQCNLGKNSIIYYRNKTS